MKRADVPGRLGALLGYLVTYAVDWKFSFVPAENTEYEPGIDREERDLDQANVVSSEIRSYRHPAWGGTRHKVLLDIDYPAYVIESSTPGHHHVYLDVPQGVKHDDYMELLNLLGRIGVIEPGYAEVSVKRGHSDLRLPWVSKADQVKHDPGPGINLQGVAVEWTPPVPPDFEFKPPVPSNLPF